MVLATVLLRPPLFLFPLLDRCLVKLYIVRLPTAVILYIFFPSSHPIWFLSHFFPVFLYSLSTDHTLLHFNFIAHLQSDPFLLLATNCMYFPLYWYCSPFPLDAQINVNNLNCKTESYWTIWVSLSACPWVLLLTPGYLVLGVVLMPFFILIGLAYCVAAAIE